MAAFAFTLGSPEHPGRHARICLGNLFPLRPATYFSLGQAAFSAVRWHRTGYGWPLWGFYYYYYFLFSPHFLWNQGNYIHIKRKKEIKSVKEKKHKLRNLPCGPLSGQENLPEFRFCVPTPWAWQPSGRASLQSRATLDCERRLLSFCSWVCLSVSEGTSSW